MNLIFTIVFFYFKFFLYPTITMDFSKVSFETAWTDDKKQMEVDRSHAIGFAFLFAFTSSNLIISIVRTIVTNPGNIPDHKEWDMSTDTSAGEESISMVLPGEAGPVPSLT